MQRTAAAVSLDTSFATDETNWSDEANQKEGTDPEDVMLRRENDAAIQRILNSLPETYRTTVELFDIQGLPCERISEIMVCPIETVRSRVHQGHLLMKKAFKEIEGAARKLH